MINNPSFLSGAGYKVATPVYEGPLDLLLQLIERSELDITSLALAQVTDQFLDYIHQIQIQETGEVSAFLVIAARLLQIKSEALLPRPPIREVGEEDPGEALAQQLIAYKRYRQIADLLGYRESQGMRTYLRLATPVRIEGLLDLSGIGLAELFQAGKQILEQARQKDALDTVVSLPRITIKEKIFQISRQLHGQKKLSFFKLLSVNVTRLDIVVTFLAVLELIKRQFVQARQTELFSDISLETTNPWSQEESFDTEFRE
jgi:segregation and condensation protein A